MQALVALQQKTRVKQTPSDIRSVKCAPELIKAITSCGFFAILIRIGT